MANPSTDLQAQSSIIKRDLFDAIYKKNPTKTAFPIHIMKYEISILDKYVRLIN